MATDATDNAADPGILDKLATLYWGNSPNINQQLRQRIALQMMGRDTKKGYPKTIGEGLSAIGDSLGDMGMARMLERSDQAAQRIAPPPAAASTADATPAASASNALAYAPPPAEEAAPVTRSLAAPPATEGQPADAPGNVMSPAVAPSSAMLSPSMPTGLGGAGPPMTPPQTASLLNPRSTLGGTVPRVPAELDPAVQPDPQQRDRMAATLNGRELPQGVQQLDPTLAGAVALPPSPTSIMARGGPQTDQRLAQLAPTNPRTVTDISRAPQPTPTPGYVPPEPGAVAGAPIIGMTTRELQLRQWLAANQGNQYAPMKVAPELNQLELARTTRQSEAGELYKEQLKTAEALRLKRQEALMDQVKRIEDAKKTALENQQSPAKFAAEQAKIKAETAASLLQDTSGKKILDPNTGRYHMPVVEGANPNAMPEAKLTEPQQKALLYHGWATTAQDQLSNAGGDELIANATGQRLLHALPGVGNVAVSDAYRQAQTASNSFVQAFLRSTSGANYSPLEQEKQLDTLLPRYGDDKQTLMNKRAQRQIFINSMYGALGEDGQAVADYNVKQYNASKAVAAATGKPHTAADLPPVVVTNKEDKDALQSGQRYRLPSDAPGVHRVKP